MGDVSAGAFMEFLRKQPGVRISPKIELADLSHRGAGRGVCKCDTRVEYIVVGASRSCLLLTVCSGGG